jgi:hypothetical protein
MPAEQTNAADNIKAPIRVNSLNALISLAFTCFDVPFGARLYPRPAAGFGLHNRIRAPTGTL